MKLVTMRRGLKTQAGRVEGDEIVALPYADVGELLALGANWQNTAAKVDGPRRLVEGTKLAPPVVNPAKIICLGLNYAAHAAEDVPVHKAAGEYPVLFSKFAATLTGPFERIELPSASTMVDWEAELVVVIGSSIRDASEREAINSIAGYAVGNDVSMRDWQRRSSQWLQGKAWDKTTPMGPLVTRDEVGLDGRPDLSMTCEVNGELMQSARTSDMICDCVDSIRYVSQFTRLTAGDLIFTGTGAGVGSARKPPVFLAVGDTLVTRIEGLDECRNEIYAEIPRISDHRSEQVRT